jgi:hypothetical protein
MEADVAQFRAALAGVGVGVRSSGGGISGADGIGSGDVAASINGTEVAKCIAQIQVGTAGGEKAHAM